MNHLSTAEYLSAHEFFCGLNDDILKFLVERSTTLEIKKGQILFKQGETADKFYIIQIGRISIQIPSIMGPNLDIQTLEKNQVLGWSWLIAPYRWNFQTTAEEDSKLLVFDGAAILAQCEREPKFGYELLKRFAALMSERLNAAREKMMDDWNPAGFA